VSPEDVAYCAGLYEGEGTVVYGSNNKGPIRAKIGSTDRDVLEILQQRAGGGYIYGPFIPHGLGSKPHFLWNINGQLAVEFLLAIYPLLGTRRKAQIDRRLSVWELRPKRKVTPSDYEDIFNRRTRGETYKSIGESYGVGFARIWQVCNKELA